VTWAFWKVPRGATRTCRARGRAGRVPARPSSAAHCGKSRTIYPGVPALPQSRVCPQFLNPVKIASMDAKTRAIFRKSICAKSAARAARSVGSARWRP